MAGDGKELFFLALYAVTKDGSRFLLPVIDPRQLSVPLTVVLNWPALVKQ